MRNGATATHASPSQVSSVRPRGSSAARPAGLVGQWAKSRSLQTCRIAQGLSGVGHGRCDDALRMSSAVIMCRRASIKRSRLATVTHLVFLATAAVARVIAPDLLDAAARRGSGAGCGDWAARRGAIWPALLGSL